MSNNSMVQMNRRMLLTMGGGAFFLAGCQAAAPGMMGAMMGGSGKDADWGSLIKSLHAALDKIADQTEELISIQASYAEVFKLKDNAAKWKGKAIAAKNGRSGIKLSDVTKASESQQKEIKKLLANGYALDARGKRTLEKGLRRHQKAIENAWVGAAMVVKVVVDARSAKKPSFRDIESVKYMKEILADGPMAIKFVQTSKKTYEAYSDTFAYEAKIVVPKPKKLAPLKF